MMNFVCECKNGAGVRGETYLNRATIALGFAKNSRESITATRDAVLRRLLKLIKK